MRKEECELFLDKLVKLVKLGKDEREFVYVGKIVKLNEESLLFKDKYNQDILFTYPTISQIMTLSERSYHKPSGGAQ